MELLGNSNDMFYSSAYVIVCMRSCIKWCLHGSLWACVCVCSVSLLGAFVWAHRCKKWVIPTELSDESRAVTGLWEGGAKTPVNQRLYSIQQSRHPLQTYSERSYTPRAAYVGGLSSELIRCVICMGWKRGCSRNMWEIPLWPWISLSCCCSWQVVTCGLILFWRTSQEVQSEWAIWSNSQWCIKRRILSWSNKRWFFLCVLMC